jgi:PAS domain S-box-containing protein
VVIDVNVYDPETLIIQNRLLSEEVKRRIDHMAAINIVAQAVAQTLDLDQTLETALSAVLEVVGAEAGGISMIDEEAGEIVLRAQRGWQHDFVVRAPMRIPLGSKGMSGRVISTDSIVVHNNLNGTEEYAFPGFRDEGFRSLAMAPMHARGKVIGILSIMSSKSDSFNDALVNVLRAVADTVGVALDNSRLYEASVEQESRLNAVLQSTADGIIATDQHGRVQLVNHTAEEMLGVQEEALIGMPLREVPIRSHWRESLLYALSSRAEGKSFQVTLHEEDDTKMRVISVVASPVYVETQMAHDLPMDGWVLVLQDVTHLRQAELERARFMQAAAHDMRNPVGVTLSSLTMLQEMVKPDEPLAQEIIQIALASLNNLRALIDDLLSLEHIQSGYQFNRDEVDVYDLLRELSASIRPIMESKGHHYSFEATPDIPVVKLDRRWVARALTNYLDNAAKYTPGGGILQLRAFVNAPMLHIEVTDNGQGIAASEQQRLFERFYRVQSKETDGIEGTGLGLAIVKSVAEAHGGTVYVRSRRGKGSTFGITLPLE